MYLLKTALVLSLLAVTSSLAFRPEQATTSSTKPEDSVLQLEHDWLAADAKADAARLGRIVADDFMGGSPDGMLLGKADIIPRGGGAGAFAGATPTDTSVRLFGDTAVLMGSIKTADSGLIRVTLVCQKRAGTWQMIAAQLAHP
jgi:ketosteroid isomerase-like protein